MTRTAYKARIGSISSGTLRSEDLLSAFSWELERSKLTRSQRKTVNEANHWLDTDEDERDEYTGSELVNELMDILNEYAPEGIYFGAHEGDGSAFGFWPLMTIENHLDQWLKRHVCYEPEETLAEVRKRMLALVEADPDYLDRGWWPTHDAVIENMERELEK